jgi:hypothetical protein
MAWLVPAIHVVPAEGKDGYARAKPGHNEAKRITTSADMVGKRRRR